MKSSRYSAYVSAIYVCILIITLSSFLILGTAPLWQGHWFISLAALLLAEFVGYVYLLSGTRSGTRRSKEVRQNVPGYFAIGTFISFYIIAVILDIVLFWLVLNLSITTYLYIHIITAAVAGIGIIAAMMSRQYISDQDAEIKAQNELMKQILLAVSSAKFDLSQRQQAALQELQRSVAALEEKVKYSDPVGHPSLVFIEESMLWQANELQTYMQELHPDSSGQYQLELPRKLISGIMSDLHKRNQKLLTLK